MVVTCAFYGISNRTTKVTLQVERDQLEVGQAFTFEEDSYVILSVFEAEGTYHANVALERVHRSRLQPRSKPTTPSALAFDQNGARHHVQESALQTRLKSAETSLQHLQRERDEMLRLLDQAIEQLDRLHRNDGTSA
jgi:hypothetical protein